MMNIFRSFYGKLSLIFLLLILMLGAGTLVIAFNAAGHLFDEVEQVLNREYAASIAVELQPIVDSGFSEAEVKDAIHYMMVLNPMVEIYLISENGEILAFFTGPGDEVVRKRIDLAPLTDFAASSGFEPVKGDDPRTPDKVKPFSAAPLHMGNDKGWVYVILRGESYDRSLEMLRNSYYLQSGMSTFFFAIFATLIAGLSLFFFLTRRLRHLGSAAEAFERGEWDYRVRSTGADEIGALGNAFNQMAESINSGVKKLHEAEQQRSDLIANISHDLRSPLTSIRGHLETILLRDENLTNAEKKRFLEVSLKNVSSFQKLVEELFDLAKLESRQARAEMEPFQMAELVQDIILKLTPQASASGIELTIDNSDELPVFTGDIGMIERVLTNIIENAISHSPDGGKVHTALSGSEDEIRTAVTDTGHGISDEDLPHIFERFYRADKSRDRSSPGTGLGLAIAKEIAELHGGTIEAGSTGTGATFLISLPINQDNS